MTMHERVFDTLLLKDITMNPSRLLPLKKKDLVKVKKLKDIFLKLTIVG
jgi:hypothetical protein